MSHEGIRFVSKEEAGRESLSERPLSRIAISPEKVRVLLTEGKGLEIDWQDGHRSAWSFAWLRDACPCATCVDERKAGGRKIGQPKPKAAALLPMYTPPAKPASAHGVGRYAMATPAASTPGTISAATASARSARSRNPRAPERPTESHIAILQDAMIACCEHVTPGNGPCRFSRDLSLTAW